MNALLVVLCEEGMAFDAQTFSNGGEGKFYNSSNFQIRKSKSVWDGTRVCPWGM